MTKLLITVLSIKLLRTLRWYSLLTKTSISKNLQVIEYDGPGEANTEWGSSGGLHLQDVRQPRRHEGRSNSEQSEGKTTVHSRLLKKTFFFFLLLLLLLLILLLLLTSRMIRQSKFIWYALIFRVGIIWSSHEQWSLLTNVTHKCGVVWTAWQQTTLG